MGHACDSSSGFRLWHTPYVTCSWQTLLTQVRTVRVQLPTYEAVVPLRPDSPGVTSLTDWMFQVGSAVVLHGCPLHVCPVWFEQFAQGTSPACVQHGRSANTLVPMTTEAMSPPPSHPSFAPVMIDLPLLSDRASKATPPLPGREDDQSDDQPEKHDPDPAPVGS